MENAVELGQGCVQTNNQILIVTPFDWDGSLQYGGNILVYRPIVDNFGRLLWSRPTAKLSQKFSKTLFKIWLSFRFIWSP